VPGADGDRGGGPSGAEVDGADGVGRLVVADVVGVAQTELAVGVPAPALHGAVVEDRARVRVGCRDGCGCTSYAEADGADCGGRLVVADVGHGAHAELAVTVVAPALHAPVVDQDAHVMGTDGQRRHRAARGQPQADGPRGAGSFVVADRGGVAVAQLAVVRPSPTAHGPSVVEHAHVLAAGADPTRQLPRRCVRRSRCAGVHPLGHGGDERRRHGRCRDQHDDEHERPRSHPGDIGPAVNRLERRAPGQLSAWRAVCGT
jgi:hypothetical protein